MNKPVDLAIDDFIRTLMADSHGVNVFNPYRENYKAENLRCYLQAVIERVNQRHEKRVLLVGEALGYRGGKLTGIPFSCGQMFDRFHHPLLKVLKPNVELYDVENENTATMVWEYLASTKRTPLFWNAYPFHPYPEGEPLKNRAPNASEVTKGVEYLRALADIFQPQWIAGIGGKGVSCAQKAFPDRKIHQIRHPSFGGKRDFVDGMDRLYRLRKPS